MSKSGLFCGRYTTSGSKYCAHKYPPASSKVECVPSSKTPLPSACAFWRCSRPSIWTRPLNHCGLYHAFKVSKIPIIWSMNTWRALAWSCSGVHSGKQTSKLRMVVLRRDFRLLKATEPKKCPRRC